MAFKKKRHFKKKGKGKAAKALKIAKKDYKDSHGSGTVFKITRAMEHKNLIFPEKFLTRQRVNFTFGIGTAQAAQNYTFHLQTTPVEPAGVAHAPAGGAQSLANLLNTISTAGNFINTGQSLAQITAMYAHGTTQLSTMYNSYKPYASSFKIRVSGNALADQIRCVFMPVVQYWTAANVIQTNNAPSIVTAAQAPYAKTFDSGGYVSQGYKWHKGFAKHYDIIGISKDELMENKMYDYAVNANQLGLYTDSAQYQNIVGWVVYIQNRSGINFSSTLMVDIEMDLYSRYTNNATQLDAY